MPPNTALEEDMAVHYEFVKTDEEPPTKNSPRKYKLIIPNCIFVILLYSAGPYGMYLFFTKAKWSTVVVSFIFYLMALLGVTAGAHRFYSHRSFKATMPLNIILMLFHSVSYQMSIMTWVRDHRLHHKYTDTDADPHNSSRGFFYSHVGWLMVEKHPEVRKRIPLVYMEDIYRNPVVMFQKRNARWLLPLLSFIAPTAIAWSFGETLWTAWFINVFRIMVTSNLAFFSNSLNHFRGYKPYDKTISACQNVYLVYLAMGEGFHNFHHVFPYDYRTGEIGGNRVNFITKFIDLCGWLGMAYDMKLAPEDVVNARKLKTGDGSDIWGVRIKKGN